VEARASATPSSETKDSTKEQEKVSEKHTEDKEVEIKDVGISETVKVNEVSETQLSPPAAELVCNSDTNRKTEQGTKETEEEIVTSLEEPVVEDLPTREDEPSIAPLEQVAETAINRKDEEKVNLNSTEKNSPELERKDVQSDHPPVKFNQSEIIKESTTEKSQSHTTLENNQSQKRSESNPSQHKPESDQSKNALQKSKSEQVSTTSQSQDRNSKRMSKSEGRSSRDSTSSFKSRPEKYSSAWYFVLDIENDKWVEFQFKPKTTDDELLFMVQNIKDARITITGVPLPGNEQRGRAMTLVSEQNSEVLKLNELKRSLKVSRIV